MKSCGIIAEYNPFHNGHRYQLQTARERSNSDVMIVVMSGNFTQRGEPAIVDKWTRTEMALQNGADIVVEQSVLGSVQATDLFAKAGVRLLHRLGCDFISFGAEDGTSEQFLQVTQSLLDNESAINQVFHDLRNDGRSYPAQMQEALTTVLGDSLSSFSYWEPNNQLGLAYLKENLQYAYPMQPIVVQRKGAKHHESLKEEGQFASGTALRKLLVKEQKDLQQWIPVQSTALLQQSPKLNWEHFWPLLQYRILLLSEAELRQVYQMEEGIEHRLKKMILQAGTFHEFIELVKNKRWTWTRLQRLSLSILLHVTPEEVGRYFQEPPAVRVLGFTQKGRQYLRQQKKERELLFLTNIHQKNQHQLEKELKADQIYLLGKPDEVAEQNYTRHPILF